MRSSLQYGGGFDAWGEWLAGQSATTAAKLALIAGGLWFLWLMSGVVAAPVLLVLVAGLSYAIAAAAERMPRGRACEALTRATIPVAFVIVVLLNVFGLIGTLTGADATISFASPMLIAAPFYLLSAAAVVTDVMARRLPLPPFVDHCLYLTLPFKLLAGPLEPTALIERFRRFRLRFSWSRLAGAWPWMALGAFMKFVIANRLDPAKTLPYTDPVSALGTASLFELKFYFDFAGYSFIGYGGAMTLGIPINVNFIHPFAARNVVLFWRRWHISLGRFLSHYILHPNIGFFSNRHTRAVFACTIFIFSAMWHGGTGNYALWGLYHSLCYFAFITWMKRWRVPRAGGMLAMFAFFVMGRLLASDANWPRLTKKLAALVTPHAWAHAGHAITAFAGMMSTQEVEGLAAAALFFAGEWLSLRCYGVRRPYHAFRRPAVALFLLVLFVLFGLPGRTLLYARI